MELEFLSEKKECLVLQLDEADRRFKIGIGKMGDVKNRIDQLEKNRTFSLRKKFLIKTISYYEKIQEFKKITASLKNELKLLNVDPKDELIYIEVINGYVSMSRRKNELEEERNSIVKDIEKVEIEINKN